MGGLFSLRYELRSFTRSSNRSSLFSSATRTTGHWDSEGLSWDQLVLPKRRNIPPSLTHSQGRLKSLGASFPVSFALLGSWGRAECSHWEQQGHLWASRRQEPREVLLTAGTSEKLQKIPQGFAAGCHLCWLTCARRAACAAFLKLAAWRAFCCKKEYQPGYLHL